MSARKISRILGTGMGAALAALALAAAGSTAQDYAAARDVRLKPDTGKGGKRKAQWKIERNKR